jgi:hypothetical protein
MVPAGRLVDAGAWPGVTTISRSPFTSAIVYLCVGILLGPSFFSIFRFEPWKPALLEMLTQVTLLISLFSAGIKMPVPFKLARWDAPLRLAWISMTLTVGLVALFAWYVLHLPARRRHAGRDTGADRSGAGHRCAGAPSWRQGPAALHPHLQKPA